MRCTKARHYIGLEPDGMLSPVAAKELREHLAACAACNSHSERLHVAVAAVTEDVVALEEGPRLSSGFQAILHFALLAEQASSRNIGGLVRLGLYPRLLRTAVAFAAVVIMAGLIAFAFLQSPKLPVQECRFGHLGSLTIKQDTAGRVYASTANRNWAGRCDLPGGRPQ